MQSWYCFPREISAVCWARNSLLLANTLNTHSLTHYPKCCPMRQGRVCGVISTLFLHCSLESVDLSLLLIGSKISSGWAVLCLCLPPKCTVYNLSQLAAAGPLGDTAVWIAAHWLLMGYLITATPLCSCLATASLCAGVYMYPFAIGLSATFPGICLLCFTLTNDSPPF